MLSKKKLNIGIVGCGVQSNVLAKASLAVSEARLVAVTDIIEERAKEMTRRFSVKPYTNYNDMLSRKDIDVVFVVVPHYLHSEVSIAAAEAGKHVFVEKPMCMNLNEANKMIDAAEKADVKLAVGHVDRFNTGWIGAKRLIDDGAIGKILMLRLARHGSIPIQRRWFFDPKKGGGLLFDRFIYEADNARWLTGSEVKEVSAYGSVLRHKNLVKKAGKEFIDTILATLKLENNIIAVIDDSYFPEGYREIRGEILGTEGAIYTFPYDGNLNLYSNTDIVKGAWGEPIPSYSKGWNTPNMEMFDPNYGFFVRELQHFINCILEDKRPIVDGKEAKASLEVVLATANAIETGKPVKLPLE